MGYNKWTPVIEDLPEEGRFCWVTVVVNGSTYVRRDSLHNDHWTNNVDDFVVAWMYNDAPEAYQER